MVGEDWEAAQLLMFLQPLAAQSSQFCGSTDVTGKIT